MLSSTGNMAMTDQWTIRCRLWTAANVDDLPLYYSFLADLGGVVGEIVLGESRPQQALTGFLLPSSRILLWGSELNNGQGGWYLCRQNCPVTLTAVILDGSGASQRVSTMSNISRPGCQHPYAPCTESSMLNIIDLILGNVDVGGPDPEQTNYQMLIVSLELSDIQSFSLNATDPLATRPQPTTNPILSSSRRASGATGSLHSEMLKSSRKAAPAIDVHSPEELELSEEESALLASALAQDLSKSVSEDEKIAFALDDISVENQQFEL